VSTKGKAEVYTICYFELGYQQSVWVMTINLCDHKLCGGATNKKCKHNPGDQKERFERSDSVETERNVATGNTGVYLSTDVY
jgi:hypothetical protein